MGEASQPAMQYKRLGGSGLKVSVLAYGCAVFGRGVDTLPQVLVSHQRRERERERESERASERCAAACTRFLTEALCPGQGDLAVRLRCGRQHLRLRGELWLWRG